MANTAIGTAGRTAPRQAVYESSHNGQRACDEHRPLYGRIPWRRISDREQDAMRAEVADILGPDESLCEVCRGMARRAKAAAMADRGAAR